MYYLLYGFVYALSLLPFWLLYGIADALFVFVYYIFPYRKSVVMENLRGAFPEQTERERRWIARRFYRNLIDNFLEAIKLLSISPRQLSKRFRCDYSLLERLYAEGRSCQVHLGHTFNWEYANAEFSAKTDFEFLVVYMPIGMPSIDRLFRHLRHKFGTILLPATDMRNAMMPYRNRRYALALVADQNPGRPQDSYWCDFLGRPAPFVKGPERGARLHDIPVVFVSMRKEKRGHYSAVLSMGADSPRDLPEGELTLRFVRFLENEIREQPEIWLWSHRRWKWPYLAEYEHLKVDR
jgi:Kdo2-lipid IVA lauroyltransferase/acyltransferase